MVKRLKGFTLLELLIVIGIIGILVAISLASYSTAQKKSRDSRRISDMKAIQAAFEQYYADNSSMYPESEADITSTPTYLPGGMPTDPKNIDPYVYTPTYDANGASYCVCAYLEATAGNDDTPDCSFTVEGTAVYYCVKNLQ